MDHYTLFNTLKSVVKRLPPSRWFPILRTGNKHEQSLADAARINYRLVACLLENAGLIECEEFSEPVVRGDKWEYFRQENPQLELNLVPLKLQEELNQSALFYDRCKQQRTNKRIDTAVTKAANTSDLEDSPPTQGVVVSQTADISYLKTGKDDGKRRRTSPNDISDVPAQVREGNRQLGSLQFPSKTPFDLAFQPTSSFTTSLLPKHPLEEPQVPQVPFASPHHRTKLSVSPSHPGVSNIQPHCVAHYARTPHPALLPNPATPPNKLPYTAAPSTAGHHFAPSSTSYPIKPSTTSPYATVVPALTPPQLAPYAFGGLAGATYGFGPPTVPNPGCPPPVQPIGMTCPPTHQVNPYQEPASNPQPVTATNGPISAHIESGKLSAFLRNKEERLQRQIQSALDLDFEKRPRRSRDGSQANIEVHESHQNLLTGRQLH